MTFLRACLAVALLLLPLGARAETFLLMAEEPGCFWCARWNEEVSAKYPKSPEGHVAPLRRYNLHDGLPEGVAAQSKVRYTPTFLLIRDGEELGRIEGYPGEDFFWGLLGQIMDRAEITRAQSG